MTLANKVHRTPDHCPTRQPQIQCLPFSLCPNCLALFPCLEHAGHFSASGPLHLLFRLPGFFRMSLHFASIRPSLNIQSEMTSPLLFSTSVPCFFFQSVSTTYLFYYVWKVKALVAQSCLTLYEPMDCSPPGFPVHRVFQARILEWVAIPFSKGSSQPRDRTWVSCIAGGFLTV